jgi:hypothetical protein
MDVLAGTDFFTVEVLTWRGLVTYYVLFFIHLDSRRVSIAGITDHPETCWMRQIACNATLEGMGHLNGRRYVLHDRDAKFCAEFRETLAVAGLKCLRLPPRSPNLNAFAERWVRSVKRSACPI